MSKKQTLTLAGRFEHVQQLCQFVADGALQSGLDGTAVFHIELACDEACTNVIEHAYGGEDRGDITVSWRAEAGEFTVTIQDNGRVFDPEEVPLPVTLTEEQPSVDQIEDSIQVGGLGIHFIRKLMDEVHFSFDENGNKLVLVKKIETE